MIVQPEEQALELAKETTVMAALAAQIEKKKIRFKNQLKD